MKNLFEKDVLAEVEQRINNLKTDAQRKWGKMDAAQMCAHCNVAFSVPNSGEKKPRMLLGYLVGWLIKPKIYDDSTLMKNSPTAKEFVMNTAKDFEVEKAKLLASVKKFNELGPTGAGRHPHPMFGALTPEQWGKFMFKHLDHHLTQFGV